MENPGGYLSSLVRSTVDNALAQASTASVDVSELLDESELPGGPDEPRDDTDNDNEEHL
jgi:hypothetical protein